MCGIVGYTGARECAPLLLDGLRRLEYRGYDSAGLAILEGARIRVVKTAGRIDALAARLGTTALPGRCGIGHTRWATHGSPTRENAHPHTDSSGRFAVVHNGIIENCDSLRAALRARGCRFASETDSEVLAHLIAEFYDGCLERAVSSALRAVTGTYGVAVITDLEPGKLVGARKGSPLIVGVGEGEVFLASDIAAVVSHTRQVVYLGEEEMAVLTPDGFRTQTLDAEPVDRAIEEVTWEITRIEKAGHPHFMLKEICEQPRSLRDAMRGRIDERAGDAHLGGLGMTDAEIARIRRVVLTACGTSWHACMIGESLLEDWARIPCEVEYASEFRYRNPVLDPQTLVVAVSQSGETADTLAALREAKRRGARVLGICNVVGSAIAREADGGMYIHAGPEIGVASTKAFSGQVATLALFAIHIARRRGLPADTARELLRALGEIPDKVETILASAEQIERAAEAYAHHDNALYLGRGYNFPVALEGALKLKEISYIHAEGYPAAEMKHGPIALIDENMPVVFLCPQDGAYEKVLSNMSEVRARHGRILAVANENDTVVDRHADAVIRIPFALEPLVPLLSVVPLQLLAYHIAVQRGCDVDRPRNLAKSVTVE